MLMGSTLPHRDTHFEWVYLRRQLLSRSEMSLEMLLSGGLSTLGSLAVVLTYMLHLLFDGKCRQEHMVLVFYVSFSNLVASVGAMLGFYTRNHEVCVFQAVTTSYFFLASALWCVVIAIQLYILVCEGKTKLKDMKKIHAFCWIFPAILTALPLTTNDYGLFDDNNVWCYIKGNSRWELLWSILAFYLWIFLSILVILVIYALIALRLRAQDDSALLWELKYLFFYPIILVLCWTGSCVNDLSGVDGPASNQVQGVFEYAVPPLQGLFFAIIFFASNSRAKMLWAKLLGCPISEEEEESDTAQRPLSIALVAPSSSAGLDVGMRSSSLESNNKMRFQSEFGERPSLLTVEEAKDDRGNNAPRSGLSARAHVGGGGVGDGETPTRSSWLSFKKRLEDFSPGSWCSSIASPSSSSQHADALMAAYAPQGMMKG